MKLEIMASDIRRMIIGLFVVISQGKLKILFNQYLTAFSEAFLILSGISFINVGDEF